MIWWSGSWCKEQTAVLYRNNDSALPLIDLLEREGVPHQHLCPRPHLLELQQGLGPGRPEAVDALILVPHNDSALPLIDLLEREGVPYACRQREGFFFTSPIVRDITGPAALEISQDIRVLPENAVCEHHLIVKVHEAVFQ